MEFDRCNLSKLELADVVAHEGVGRIRMRRVADHETLAGTCHFIDLAEIPPGASVGRHQHAASEEEFYLVLSGTGEMWRDGETFPVTTGDLIRNRPGGRHGLVNTVTEPLRIFVFEVAVTGLG
jgi:mannose-6-phosphate isomerase-like protein (cupin superfamily)